MAKEDVPESVTLTITSARAERFEGDAKPKLVLSFQETGKDLILNRANIETLVAMYQTEDTANWIGRHVTLFVDPNVTFGGRRVGGIRVDAPPAQQPAGMNGPALRAA